MRGTLVEIADTFRRQAEEPGQSAKFTGGKTRLTTLVPRLTFNTILVAFAATSVLNDA